MSDDKLRELRAFVHAYRTEPLQPAAGWSALGYVIEEIDRLLADPASPPPECRQPEAERCKVHPFASWTCSRGTEGCTLAHSYEPLPELVARLCGYVGPDGKGRP